MKSVLLLLLSLCGHQAGGVHLHASRNTTGSSDSTVVLPVAIVMFDSSYAKLFKCFLRYWSRQIYDRARTFKLDVVTYDTEAYQQALGIIPTYPAGVVRSVQLLDPPSAARHALRRAASNEPPRERSKWRSVEYEAYFWTAILQRLEKGEDVLHIDLDAVVVGDAWAPLGPSHPGADIVAAPGRGRELAQSYILYRSTPATKEVVGHFSSVWEEWISRASNMTGYKLPLRAAQPALGEYIMKYNMHGCRDWKNVSRVCKTHTGGTFSWETLKRRGGLVQNGQCKPPECGAQGTHVTHGRSRLWVYCAAGEIPVARERSPRHGVRRLARVERRAAARAAASPPSAV